MTVREVLRDMGKKCFTREHFTDLETAYRSTMADGVYAEVEADYEHGHSILEANLTEAQMALVAEAEAAYRENLIYAAKHGFIKGLCEGFRLYNLRLTGGGRTPNLICAMQSDPFELDAMLAHPKFNRRNRRCLEIAKQLQDDLSEEVYECTEAVGYAWEERILFAAQRDFYLGYRVSLACLDRIDPAASISMLPDTLLLEYNLGLIHSYDYMESHRNEGEDHHGN